MKIEIDELYCGPEHLHCLCTCPEDAVIQEIGSEMNKQTRNWMSANGYPEVEWNIDFLAFKISEDKLDEERRFIREQDDFHKSHSFPEEFSMMLSNVI